MGFVFEKVDESFFPTGVAVGGGEETTYLENYRLSRDLFESQNRSDSESNLLMDKINPIIDKIDDRLGINLRQQQSARRDKSLTVGNMWESTLDDDVDEMFNMIKNNKELFPDVSVNSLNGIYKQIADDISKTQAKKTDVEARQTGMGAVGDFAGMASAAATDPVNMTAMVLDVLFTKGAARGVVSGFLGKQTLQLMLRESLIAATSETVIQKPVSDWYKKLDLPYDFGTFTTNVLSASAGAAVFTGGISAIVPGFKLGKQATIEGIEAFEKASALVKGKKYKKNPDLDVASKLDDANEIISASNPNKNDAGDFENTKAVNAAEEVLEGTAVKGADTGVDPRMVDEMEAILDGKKIDGTDGEVNPKAADGTEPVLDAKEFDGPNSKAYKEQMAILGSEFEQEFAAKGDAFLDETVPMDLFDSATNEFIQTEVKIKDIADEISQDKTMVERLEGCLS
jgi:hypothetical protein